MYRAIISLGHTLERRLRILDISGNLLHPVALYLQHDRQINFILSFIMNCTDLGRERVLRMQLSPRIKLNLQRSTLDISCHFSIF